MKDSLIYPLWIIKLIYMSDAYFYVLVIGMCDIFFQYSTPLWCELESSVQTYNYGIYITFITIVVAALRAIWTKQKKIIRLQIYYKINMFFFCFFGCIIYVIIFWVYEIWYMVCVLYYLLMYLVIFGWFLIVDGGFIMLLIQILNWVLN